MDMEDNDELESGAQKETQEDQREYVACLKCTHDCFYSAHSASSAPPSASHVLPPTALSFLKVLDESSSSWLEIPQAFVDACPSRCMGEAKLEGPSGWVWYAPFVHDTSNNLGKVALGSPGWDDFAHDHMLQRGDLLVLTYFSVRQLFKVRIFDAFEGTEKSQHCLPSKPHYVSMSHCIVSQKTTSTMELQVNDNKNRGYATEPKGEPREPENHFDGLGCKPRSLKQENEKSKHSASDDHEKNLDNSKALDTFKRERESEQLIRKNRSVPLGRYKIPRCLHKGMYSPYAIASSAEKVRVEKEAKAFYSKYPFLIKSLSASSIYKDRKLVSAKLLPDAILASRKS